MTNKKQPTLVASDLHKSYSIGTPQEVEVLKGINLKAYPGEFIAITGESGSGKSTFLNMLSALDTPTSGEVTIDEQPISDLDSDGLAHLRNRTIGLVFQFHHILTELTCWENICIPVMIREQEVTPEQEAWFNSLFKEVGMYEQRHKLASQISGGQQQRVAIIRALVNKPKLVLADEPTGNLDSVTSEHVFELLKRLTRELQSTFLMVTHSQDLAAKADRRVHLRDGTLAEIPPDTKF